MSLAVTLKQLRLKKGVSLQAVADAVGVSKPHIWELERGTSKNPSLELLKALATYYSVTVDYLSGLDDDAQNARVQALARDAQQLSENDLDALRHMTDVLLRNKKE